MKLRLAHFGLLAALSLSACEGILDAEPTLSVPADDLGSAREVELAVRGAYDALTDSEYSGDGTYSRNLVLYPDAYADVLTATGTYQTDKEVGARNVTASNGAVAGIWGAAYEGINRANNVLAAIGDVGSPAVADLSVERAERFRGEALFLRALHYFNLVRFFGGVPLVLEPTAGVGEGINVARATEAEVYAQIEADLREAVALLPDEGAPQVVSQSAARALLAKVYAQQAEWQEALDAAGAVIESGNFALVADYADIWRTENSAESIFELQYSTIDTNALAFWLFPSTLGGRRGFGPRSDLLDAYEAGDERQAFSVGYEGSTAYVSKYFRLSGDDNVIVLRLADVYLLRAEAYARLGMLQEAVEDLNVVRVRAGLDPIEADGLTRQQVLDRILAERLVELAFEGQRFFDLKRFGVAEEVLGVTANRLLFPIPQRELDVNDQLTQNPGY